ncbi:MAG: hypothetical protein R2712_02380 [Vicinamibacterales bacterium]
MSAPTAARRREDRPASRSNWRRSAAAQSFVAFQDFLGLPTMQMEFDFEQLRPHHSLTRGATSSSTWISFAVSKSAHRHLG